MYLKALLKSRICLFVILGFISFSSCSNEIGESISSKSTIQTSNGLLLVTGQLQAPQSIKSIQLYKKGSSVHTLPVLKLDSEDKLVLEFDELTTQSGQFIIRFTHHNQNWEKSGMPDPWIIDGINELDLVGGVRNQLSDPQYFHYKMEFPNNRFSFLVSGNYLVHVYDYQSGTELFSLPFFVSENVGDVDAYSETVFNAGENGEALDQLFGKYSYPDFVEFPQFDLSYSFTQNRFWGQSKTSREITFHTEGFTEFRLSRVNSFQANFDFTALDLSTFSTQDHRIFDFQPGYTPPRIILRDDYLNFLATPKNTFQTEYGIPNSSRSARYGEISFSLNTGGQLNLPSPSIFLIGDFNQWSISDRYKLRYNAEKGIYETRALIKQGTYSYKYVLLQNDVIDPLTLSDSITKQSQEYTGFVYYKDPQYQYSRLLKVKSFFSLR